MLHRPRARAGVLRHARGDAGYTPIESLIRATLSITAGAMGFVAVARLKTQIDALEAGRPAPALLPEATIPWAAVAIAAGAFLLAAVIALAAVAWRIAAGAPVRPAAQTPRRAMTRSSRTWAHAWPRTRPATSWTSWCCSRL
ncbi:hypothetical protein [Streptomyces lutosisoli]|uniref:DUF202 domain-containing protein n=1 Tax=Streptomyces lutosisoli TaxID=2665721 RepID=A0ABW2VV14_9ACTN